MMYHLRMHRVEGVAKRYSSFGDTDGVRGDVVIRFEGPAEVGEKILKDANIPLFLSNLLLFLERLEKHEDAVLTTQFSPNANGRLKEGTLLLSRTSGHDFESGIYDVCGGAKLKALKRKLSEDIKEYGVIDRRMD